jgi:hypothetical protein
MAFDMLDIELNYIRRRKCDCAVCVAAFFAHSTMSQPLLPFTPITTDAWRAQVIQTAAAAATAAALLPPRPPKRPVGRPKRALNANAVMAAAAAAEERPQKKHRGKYTDWFSSPFIHDILREYEKSGFRPALAVQRLKDSAPDDRFARLTHTTVIGWFDKEHNLLPRFRSHLESGFENVRQNGPVAAFEENPGIEEEIKATLLQLRAAGTPINSHVIRWVMQGVIHHRTPEGKLQSLKLGQSYICAWARKTLKWSWRSSTTAASKLPLDWEEQGLQMAMCIAANMEKNKVSAA